MTKYETCETCFHWRTDDDDRHKHPMGECRIRAPKADTRKPESLAMAVWPILAKQLGCGEHEPVKAEGDKPAYYQHTPLIARVGDAVSYPCPVYMDKACTIQHPDPIICDSKGVYPDIYMPTSYPYKPPFPYQDNCATMAQIVERRAAREAREYGRSLDEDTARDAAPALAPDEAQQAHKLGMA